MDTQLANKTVRQYVDTISDQYYPMTGSVIAAMAAQGAALAEACIQISLDNQIDTLDWRAVTARIEQMAHLKATLLEWSNQEISVGHNGSPPSVDPSRLQKQMDGTAEIANLALEATRILDGFRPMVFPKVESDLEIVICLLTSTAQAALLLLKCHLDVATDPKMVERYQPMLAELKQQIDPSITPRSVYR